MQYESEKKEAKVEQENKEGEEKHMESLEKKKEEE